MQLPFQFLLLVLTLTMLLGQVVLKSTLKIPVQLSETQHITVTDQTLWGETVTSRLTSFLMLDHGWLLALLPCLPTSATCPVTVGRRVRPHPAPASVHYPVLPDSLCFPQANWTSCTCPDHLKIT
jgi:nitrogen fixation protein